MFREAASEAIRIKRLHEREKIREKRYFGQLMLNPIRSAVLFFLFIPLLLLHFKVIFNTCVFLPFCLFLKKDEERSEEESLREICYKDLSLRLNTGRKRGERERERVRERKISEIRF